MAARRSGITPARCFRQRENRVKSARETAKPAAVADNFFLNIYITDGEGAQENAFFFVKIKKVKKN